MIKDQGGSLLPSKIMWHIRYTIVRDRSTCVHGGMWLFLSSVIGSEYKAETEVWLYEGPQICSTSCLLQMHSVKLMDFNVRKHPDSSSLICWNIRSGKTHITPVFVLWAAGLGQDILAIFPEGIHTQFNIQFLLAVHSLHHSSVLWFSSYPEDHHNFPQREVSFSALQHNTILCCLRIWWDTCCKPTCKISSQGERRPVTLCVFIYLMLAIHCMFLRNFSALRIKGR